MFFCFRELTTIHKLKTDSSLLKSKVEKTIFTAEQDKFR